MTPKERAIDIFENYRALLGWNGDRSCLDEDARLAATIAVELVLETARPDEHCTSREYWLLVKKEIQNL